MPRDVPSWAASQGQQALAASCRDCSAGWLPQEHTRVSWCRDCTEAFRQGRQAPAVSCMDCTAVWLLSERIRIAWCTDYIAAAPSPPPNLEGIEKAQMRTLAWHGTRFIRPTLMTQHGSHPPSPLVWINGAVLHNRVNCVPFGPERSPTREGGRGPPMAPSRPARPIEGTSVSGLIRGELSAAGG